MKLKQYQVDAFASKVFQGNPAAVCPLDAWLEDKLLQAIAEENNLSETAFMVPSKKGYELRWFTPVAEVDLCGHATLASAFVLFEKLGYKKKAITFETRSGDLVVHKDRKYLVMDFPAKRPIPCTAPQGLVKALGSTPREILIADDYVVVFDNENTIQSIKPDMNLLSQVDKRGIAITAPGNHVDFVSRFFAPKLGINEDPVTGSAHCELAPYWAEKLGKKKLLARQISRRGGEITCEVKEDRVLLSGQAVLFMEAEIYCG